VVIVEAGTGSRGGLVLVVVEEGWYIRYTLTPPKLRLSKTFLFPGGVCPGPHTGGLYLELGQGALGTPVPARPRASGPAHGTRSLRKRRGAAHP
jgi:hypothetical protein